MGGKYSWIVLFVTLQISVVLCRSTEKPKEEDKVIHAGPILLLHGQASVVENVGQYFADNFGEPTPESPVPSKKSHDDGNTYDSYRIATLAGILCGLTVGIFCIIALFVVCIVFCCSQKETRRPGRTAGMLQQGTIAPGAPGTVTPIQRYPPRYGQTQYQNIYPSVYPSN